MSHRYQLLETLGDGTYGTVVKARHRTTGSVVAIKQLRRRYQSWPEAVNLREVASLRKLSNHPHIVEVRELIRDSDGSLYFVFEYMADGNLYELIRHCTRQEKKRQQKQQQIVAVSDGGPMQRRPAPAPVPVPPRDLTDNRVRSIVRQILDGLSYMHSQGYFHRDVKPENILLRGDTCKVADFGLAREIQSNPPYTDYVSTRWYRAPEVLLRAPRYDKSVDSFAVGCILAELYNLCPLFPGRDELDQIFKICSVIGIPTRESWADGVHLARKHRIGFPTIIPYHHRHQYRDLQRQQQQQQQQHNVIVQVPLERAMKGAPKTAQDLSSALLTLDPAKRLDASDALRHEYLATEVGGGSKKKRGIFDAFGIRAANRHQQNQQQQQIATAKSKRSRMLEERQDFQDPLRSVGDDYFEQQHQQHQQQQPNHRQPDATVAYSQPQEIFRAPQPQSARSRVEKKRGHHEDFASKAFKDPSNRQNVSRGRAKSGGFHDWLRAGKTTGGENTCRYQRM